MLSNITNDFLHLFFPHNCEGCGTDVLQHDQLLCAACKEKLPQTGYCITPHNPVEKVFYGRLPLQAAAAAWHFTKASLLQHLVFQLKYRNNPAIGVYLGRLLGHELMHAPAFNTIQALVPMPLHPKKQHVRGYNQAQAICQGITAVWHKPIVTTAIVRASFTDTQTHHNRLERWENMKNVFQLQQPGLIQGKHVLLVDDVITTGASIEACGNVLLQATDSLLSVAALAFTT
jgi:ComF family protein